MTHMGMVIRNTLYSFYKACKITQNKLHARLTISKTHSVQSRHPEPALLVNQEAGSRKTNPSPCLGCAAEPYRSK
jgi:hypothetical protein